MRMPVCLERILSKLLEFFFLILWFLSNRVFLANLEDVAKSSPYRDWKRWGHNDNVIEKQELPPRIALVMGREADGVSTEMLEACSLKVYLPMYGFSDSFNVSVAAALSVQRLFDAFPHSRGYMSDERRTKLRSLWYAISKVITLEEVMCFQFVDFKISPQVLATCEYGSASGTLFQVAKLPRETLCRGRFAKMYHSGQWSIELVAQKYS